MVTGSGRVNPSHQSPAARISQQKLIHLLRAFPELAKMQLPPNELQAIASAFTIRTIRAGMAPVLQDAQAKDVFVVASGSFSVFREESYKRVTQLPDVGPGGTFGEMALINGAPRSATVRAKVDSEVLVIDREKAESLLNKMAGRSLYKILFNLCAQRQGDGSMSKALLPLIMRSFAPHCSDLTEEQALAVARQMEVKIFNSGEAIIRERDTDRSMYLIVSGLVSITGTKIIGNRVRKRGDTIGFLSYQAKTAERTANAVALNPVVALVLKEESACAVNLQAPSIITALSKIEEERIAADASHQA